VFAMTTRRGFLQGMLALGAAPAIIRVAPVMKLCVPTQPLVFRISPHHEWLWDTINNSNNRIVLVQTRIHEGRAVYEMLR
jgi:hypothetical protein